MAKRAAQGAGTIRKKTVTRNGKEYTYWEARITVGRDPGTGKQIQRSFSGKTQKEVREKMQAAVVSVNEGTYSAPQKMTVGEWLDIWTAEYMGNLKPATVNSYTSFVRNHIKPALGAIKLSDLHTHTVQTFINNIKGVSPTTVRLIYKALKGALSKAVKLEYIPKNPANNCTLPKAKEPDIKPLTDEETAVILAATKGTDLENIVIVALFTGLRASEIIGLTWDNIDFKKGTLTINKQLARLKWRKDSIFLTPKSGKSRTLTPAQSVMSALKDQKIKQAQHRLAAGELWLGKDNLVFTLEDGSIFEHWKVDEAFRSMTKTLGLVGVRFHDMRHTYAVNAIRAGDDIKTIQSNLGHSSAAFTLDKYGHFTERMKQDSAARMEHFINEFINL